MRIMSLNVSLIALGLSIITGVAHADSSMTVLAKRFVQDGMNKTKSPARKSGVMLRALAEAESSLKEENYLIRDQIMPHLQYVRSLVENGKFELAAKYTAANAWILNFL